MKKLMMTMVMVAGMATAAWADVSFSYSGCLRDASGNAVEKGTKTITFRLYEGANDETSAALWEGKRTVTVDDQGYFSIELTTQASDPDNKLSLETIFREKAAVYIGLTVKDSAGEIRPRQRLLDVPMASVARDALAAKGDFTVNGKTDVLGGLRVYGGGDGAEVLRADQEGVVVSNLVVGSADAANNTSGTATFNCPITFNSKVTAKQPFAAEGELSGQSLKVTKGASVGGDLTVTGAGTLGGTLSANELKVTKSATVGGALTVTGDITAEGKSLTVGTVTASQFNIAGSGSIAQFTKGMIMMWYGLSTEVPAGWALCDGNDHVAADGTKVTTPDLRGRFVVGVGQTVTNKVAFGTTYGLGNIGGEETHKLQVSEMPQHNHEGQNWCRIGVDNNTDYYLYVPQVDNGKTSPSGSELSKKNVDTLLKEVGGNAEHENRPPYYALHYIMKL